MRMVLTLAMVMLASPALAQQVVPIDTKPYQFTLTSGLVCGTEAALKAALDAVATVSPLPNVPCMVLPDGFSEDVTATPVERYTNAKIDGIITQFNGDGGALAFGLAKVSDIGS